MPLPDAKRWFVSRHIPETKFSGMPSHEGHRLLMSAMQREEIEAFDRLWHSKREVCE